MTLQAGGNIGGADAGRRLGAGNHDRHARRCRRTCRPAACASTSSRATAATRSRSRRSSPFRTRACRATTSPTSWRGRPRRRRTGSSSNWDLNAAFGGPIKRDKVWFWFSAPLQRDARMRRRRSQNRNAFNPNEWLYVPDTSQPGVNEGSQVSSSIRVTWQATPRNKFAGHLQGRQVVPLSEHHQRHARAGGRARSPLPAAAAGARRVDLAGDQPPAGRGRRHAPLRALGQHAPARRRRLRSRPRRTKRAVPQMIPVVEQGTGLQLPRSLEHLQQHAGAELRVSRRRCPM